MGPLLFNISLSGDLLLIVKDADSASYDDDDILHDSCSFIEEIILSLQSSSKNLFQWLLGDQIKGNTEQCHFIMITNEHVDFQLGNSLIVRSSSEKMLRVTIE